MNDEIFEKLKEQFPVLEKIGKYFKITTVSEENNEVLALTKFGMTYGEDEFFTTLTQQDCLELSQLFALLATAYEEVSEND